MEINSVCVCGAGTMGSGIALVSAQAGYHTLLFDLNESVIEKARMSITQQLEKLVSKDKISAAHKHEILQRLQFTSDLQSCLADIFIEAIIEKPEAKVSLFNQLAELNHSECIFASNTSSLSIKELAQKIQHPGRVIGMHFFNPAPLMKLVEIVHTGNNSTQTIETAVALAKSMGKTPVLCLDSPGFIVNRVARPYYIESLRLLEQGWADIGQIDRLMEASGFRMGPFRLMDLIGNDINFAVSNSVYEQLGRPERLKPSHIQQSLVAEGKLGKKSGRGYYDYEVPANKTIQP